MGGNVREWCWNETKLGRFVRGGAWNDNPYMFKVPSQADPLDRSAFNGFRCVSYPSKDDIPETAFDWMEESTPFHSQPVPEPVTDEEFARYKDFYDYDSIDLAAIVESTRHNDKGWTLEKITLNAAYDNERVTAYLFLPDNAEPPFQTVVYGPGSGVFYQESSEDIENYYEFPAFLRFYLKSGRAILFPIVKESFERGSEHSVEILFSQNRLFTDFMTRVVKDYRICLDYLETREEIDTDRLVFYGMSYGPTIGFHLTAVEPRIKINIFYAGGLMAVGRPESNAAHFIPRVTIPTLMINGRYDSNFKVDFEIKHMFEMLGTPEENKRLVLLDSDHLAPKEDLVRETLLWLDENFGQVELIDAPRLLGAIDNQH
jgi:dienelactone hydrolase